MPKYSINKLKLSSFNILLLVIYLGLFVYFILQPAIYSPDTNTYFRLHFYRFPVYGLFLRVFDLVFGSFYNLAVVGFQLLLGFASILILAKNCKRLLKLNYLTFFGLLAVLTFPYFPPLLIANNICTEGLSYPLYLLLISFAFDFFFREQPKKLFHLSVIFVLLCLTRGQFIIIAPIFAVLYFLKERKKGFKKGTVFTILLFLLLPIVTQTLDKTYHKMVHGFFVTTPFSYINALTLPLFVSEEKDALQFKTQDEKTLFLHTYKTIDSLGLLSSSIDGDATSKYLLFHNNFPMICNRNFHIPGLEYFEDKTAKPGENVVLIEEAAKAMFPVLVTNNFEKYISIYFQGIFHGFKGILISVVVLLIFLYSCVITLKKWSLHNGLLLLFTTLIVSNSMLVAFASHSIMRYLFYNYFFAILIGVILIRKLTAKQ